MDIRTQRSNPETDAGPTASDAYCFGPFRLHVAQRRIEKDGSPVALPARAFDILVALIAQPGEIVSKNELMAKVWPGVTVDAGSLRGQVAALRKALGDGEAGASYLRTVSGQGYCFVAQVSRPNDAKPPPSSPAHEQDHHLPAPPRRMVGRDRTVEEISDKLTNKRFVTIVGPGGIGKTTVAVSTGYALLKPFAGQVRFFDLGAIRDAALVPNVIVSALGVLARSNNPSDSLVAFLRDKRMLLILDCCEHVIETVAALAERLYREAPQLHILTTSRESLRVEGEQIHRLLPLASPPDETGLTATSALTFPAVELFVERAAASSGQFELNDANASDVADICRRLDGIALAIELAASRVGAYGVKHTVELLNGQFNLLWEGRRTVLPRHRTLRATIDWSYNLLSEPERATLCRLSIFFGNFTLDAARSVATTEDTDDTALPAILASLVAKSMLTLSTSRSSARYRLLDTTRAYVQEILVASLAAEMTARRHAYYFRDLLESIGDRSSDELSALADQFGNVRGALMWCFSDHGDRAAGVALAAASMPLFFELSLLAECQFWAMRAIESLDGNSDNLKYELDLHAALGMARMMTEGITDSVGASLTRAFRLAEQLGDVPNQLRMIDRLHLLHIMAGNFDDSLNIARRGESIAAGNGDFVALARNQVSLGISCHLIGDVPASRAHIDAALSHPVGWDPGDHNHLNFDYPRRAQITLARILWLQGFPDQSREITRRAVADVIAIDHPVKLCRALLWAFAVFYWNDETAHFEEHVDRIILESHRHALDFLQTIGQAVKGVVVIARGDSKDGLALLQSSVEKMHNDRYGPQTDFSIQLAETLAAVEQYDDALNTIDRAISRAGHHNLLFEMPDMLRVKGEVLISMRRADFARAERCMKQSLDLARRQGALGLELRTAVSLARLWLRQGRPDVARGVLAPVHARFTEGFDSRLLTTARDLLSGSLRISPSD
jgi:predicted ATPase/DNA-binding winged helix-turn-helix (wHTH) protein